jgi:hypothetical protein
LLLQVQDLVSQGGKVLLLPVVPRLNFRSQGLDQVGQQRQPFVRGRGWRD